MDHLSDVPRIACDEDWLDLGEGERGMLRGRLYGPLRQGDASLIVAMTSWEIIAVTIEGGYQGEQHPAGASVTVIAQRNEDGLAMQSDDMTVHPEEN